LELGRFQQGYQMGSEAAMQTQKQTSAKDRVWTGLPEASKRRKRTGIDPDLVLFLECGGYWLGEKGTLGGIIAQLERGGAGGGMPNTDPYKDAQVGWGRNGETIGLVEKHRWLNTAWLALTHQSQRILLARCAPPPPSSARTKATAPATSTSRTHTRSGRGPFSRSASAASPSSASSSRRSSARWERDASRISAAASRTSVEAELGEFATLAIMLCPTPDKLLQACSSPNKKNSPCAPIPSGGEGRERRGTR
jgi:hypothetical protein